MIQQNITDKEETLAQTVRRVRRSARLTQVQLATLAGVGPRFIHDLEAGKSSIRLDTLERVLGVLGLRLRALPAVTPVGTQQ